MVIILIRMGNCNNKVEPENIVLDWKSTNNTYKYHWWPMYESHVNDCNNNLYSKDNGLDKYDTLFGTNSLKYKYKHYRINTLSLRKDKDWAGFCHNASILSSLYPYPKRNVIVKHKEREIEFNLLDIETLMIIASNNSVRENMSLCFGSRNNNNLKQNRDEPSPSNFLYMLNIICNNNTPFIMDIDNKNPVWNYAFDSVMIYECYSCPLKHDIPNKDSIIYYNFKIFSTAYPHSNQDLWAYISTQYNANNEIISQSEKWLSDIHPDFLWQKYPLNKPWNGKCKLNPEIDARIVYYIYKESISNSKSRKISIY